MDPAPIRFVYFDLDDTLLDHRRAERRGLADLCRAHGPHFGRVTVEAVQQTYHAHSVPLWKQYAAGVISKAALQRLRFERTLDELGIAGLDADRLNADYLERYAAHWHWPAPARRAYSAVGNRLPVGLLTNGFAEVQHAKLDRFPVLRERAAAVVISEDVGYMKPHPKIFAHAADVAGAAPETILYVGDSLHSDVEGALGAGWQAAWFSDAPEAPDGVFQFTRWGALEDWLLG